VANRILGSDAAGLLAVVLNTSNVYVRRILLSVVEPVLVPLGARIDIQALSARARSALADLDGTFAFLITVGTVCVSALTPVLVQVWLGPVIAIHALEFQILVLAVGFQISFAWKRSFLVGKGHAARLAWVSLPIALLAAGGSLASAMGLGAWQGIVLFVAGYFFVSSVLAVGLPFEQIFSTLPRGRTLRFAVCTILGGSGGILVSRIVSLDAVAISALALVCALLTSVALCHLLVLPAPRVLVSVRTLLAGGNRRVVEDRAVNGG
ncbi:MAG: hypothetical protein JRF61_00780, partial [Deltaproteobacteria bacterium]|nr:hypothetical protein [Deltaproteobacteria bacterium]